MLSHQATEEFKQIFQEEFGVCVSDEYAVEQGTNLLALMNHVYRPVTQAWNDEFESKDTI